LKQATSKLEHYFIPKQHVRSKVLQLASSCTGACSEAAALEALGLPYLISGASEKNGKFAAIFNHNFQVDHLWETMKEQVSERPCQLFGCKGLGSCSMRNELDIWVMGTPCPPFSEQNVSRKKPGAVEGHALYSVTFTDALAAICSGHKAYLLEQVPGFNKPYDSDSSETPLDRFIGKVNFMGETGKIKGNAKYWNVVIEQNLDLWIKMKRKRIYVFFLRTDVYSYEDCRRLKGMVEELTSKIKNDFDPKSIGELLLPAGDPYREAALKELEEKRVVDRDAPNQEWQKQDRSLRKEFGVSDDYNPWTSRPDFTGLGLSKTPRVKSILDGTVIRILNGQRTSRRTLKNHLKEKYVDVSQSLKRKSFSDAHGFARTQTTSTILYSFDQDRVVVGREMLLLQGHSRNFRIPPGVKDTVVKELAGEGMAVPCVGLLLWCLFWTRRFP